MGLGQVALGPVEFRQPPTTRLHWHPEVQETVVQCSPGAVHRRRILQGCFGLPLHLRMAELFGSLVALGLIAGMTGQGEIPDPITAPTTAWEDVLDLPAIGGGGRLLTVGTAVVPLAEEILPHFHAS